MALPGELKGLGGTTCVDCGAELDLDVQRSAVGYYLGYFCPRCGPYSRETGYFATYERAEIALCNFLGDGIVPDNIRRSEK